MDVIAAPITLPRRPMRGLIVMSYSDLTKTYQNQIFSFFYLVHQCNFATLLPGSPHADSKDTRFSGNGAFSEGGFSTELFRLSAPCQKQRGHWEP